MERFELSSPCSQSRNRSTLSLANKKSYDDAATRLYPCFYQNSETAPKIRFEELAEALRSLSPDQRAKLAALLLDSGKESK